MSPLFQEDGASLFRHRTLPQSLYQAGVSEDVTSDEERMVICEEEGDDDVLGKLDDHLSGLVVVRGRLLHNHKVIVSVPTTISVSLKNTLNSAFLVIMTMSAKHLKSKKSNCVIWSDSWC